MFLRNWFVVMNDKQQQQRSVNHSTAKKKRKGNLHICFSSTLATKNPFALVSRGGKKKYHNMFSQLNTVPPSSPAMFV